MFKKIFLGFAVLFTSASTVFAAHPLITDDTGTQGKGKYQFEFNGEIGFDKESSQGLETKVRASQVAAAISAGLTDTVDLVVGAPWQWNRVREDGSLTSDTNGIGDTTIEVKWRFFEYKGFSLAAKPGLMLPSGNENRGLGNGRISYQGMLVATQEIEPFTFHLNAGYAHHYFRLQADQDSNHSDIFHISGAGSYEITKGLAVVANIGAETHADKSSRNWPAFIIGGVIYSPLESLDFDLGVKGGVTTTETDLTVMAGVSLRF